MNRTSQSTGKLHWLETKTWARLLSILSLLVLLVFLIPTAGSAFAGWSEDCSSTSNCEATMSSAKSAAETPHLNDTTYTLTVNVIGTGLGTVISDPPGIFCSSFYGGGASIPTAANTDIECSQTFPTSTLVSLIIESAQGSVFTGWSGDCSGTGTCNVMMTDHKGVTAVFIAMADNFVFLPLTTVP